MNVLPVINRAMKLPPCSCNVSLPSTSHGELLYYNLFNPLRKKYKNYLKCWFMAPVGLTSVGWLNHLGRCAFETNLSTKGILGTMEDIPLTFCLWW